MSHSPSGSLEFMSVYSSEVCFVPDIGEMAAADGRPVDKDATESIEQQLNLALYQEMAA